VCTRRASSAEACKLCCIQQGALQVHIPLTDDESFLSCCFLLPCSPAHTSAQGRMCVVITTSQKGDSHVCGSAVSPTDMICGGGGLSRQQSCTFKWFFALHMECKLLNPPATVNGWCIHSACALSCAVSLFSLQLPGPQQHHRPTSHWQCW
jgi:hypothetical protein